MKSTTLAFLALASAAVAQNETAAEDFADYLQTICFPYDNATGIPDFNAPCNAAQNILIECTYGPGYNFSDNDTGSFNGTGPTMLSNTTQQSCICQSQFWNQQEGCSDCYIAHGDTDFDQGVEAPVFTSLSSSYCAASMTPTLGFADWLQVAGESVISTISAPGTTATSYSDPIGSNTAVSLYFTASITGSEAYNAPTGTAVNTVSGQIVATASQTGGSSLGGSSPSGGSQSTTTTSGMAAGTPKAMAAAAGVIGFAGLVALL